MSKLSRTEGHQSHVGIEDMHDRTARTTEPFPVNKSRTRHTEYERKTAELQELRGGANCVEAQRVLGRPAKHNGQHSQHGQQGYQRGYNGGWAPVEDPHRF